MLFTRTCVRKLRDFRSKPLLSFKKFSFDGHCIYSLHTSLTSYLLVNSSGSFSVMLKPLIKLWTVAMLSLVNRSIENRRPEIFNLTFNGDLYRVIGHEGNTPETDEFHYGWAISFCSREGDWTLFLSYFATTRIIVKQKRKPFCLPQVQNMGLTCRQYTNALNHWQRSLKYEGYSTRKESPSHL